MFRLLQYQRSMLLPRLVLPPRLVNPEHVISRHPATVVHSQTQQRDHSLSVIMALMGVVLCGVAHKRPGARIILPGQIGRDVSMALRVKQGIV